MHQVSSENQNDEMEVDRNYYSHEDFQELVQKNSELSNELNKCSQEMNEYKEKLDEKEEKLNEKEDQVKEISEKYKQSLNALQKLYQDELNEKNNLKDQLESLSTENEKFKKVQSDYTAICDENEKLKVQLESLSTENERLKKAQIDYDNEYNSLDEQLSSLRKENKILRNRQKNDSNEISNLKDQNIKMKADYDDINDKLKIYLDNDKKNNKNPSVYKENSDLKVQVKDLKKKLQTLNSDKEKLTNRVTESEKILAENKLLKDKISALSKIEDYSAIRTENDILKDKLKQFEDKQIKDKNGKISKFQNKSNELESIEQLQKEEYIKEISDLNSSLQKRGKEIQDLIEKNNSLKKEASQYQSVLGTVTSYRMDDDDKNHSVQLKKDIEDLQNKLKNYVTTLKGDCEIDFNMVNSLMKKYNIKTKVTPEKPNKPLIKAVLQYHIIKKITRDFREYLKQNSKGSIMHLEAEIATKAKDLEDRLAYFSKTRSGTDTTTQSTSIKIRQEVNIALGNRGFSDVSNGGLQEHAYIASKNTELNKEMDKYRKIKDENKRKYVEKSAADLIREFIRIIHFRLKVQEPSAQIRWIKIDSNIDPSIMEGSWDKDDIDNLEAEVCYFPMIGRDLDDVEKRKIYTHAQVFVKRKNGFVKGLGSYWSKKSKVNLEPESDDDSQNGVD